MSWWHGPLVHLNGRMDPSSYDSEGTVVLGYTLFAFGLAVLGGAIWRRAVPALTIAFTAYFALRIFVDVWLRQRLVAPLQATWSITGHQPANLAHAWVMSEGASDRLGHPAALPMIVCAKSIGRHSTRVLPGCFKHGAGYMHAVYQPNSHFWALQGVETALFGGTALVLILAAGWWTHRRVA